MTASASLIPELEDVIQNGTPERRATMLRQVTTLFLDGAPQFADQHITLFDDVMLCLVTQIEAQVLAELSRSLAPVANARLVWCAASPMTTISRSPGQC